MNLCFKSADGGLLLVRVLLLLSSMVAVASENKTWQPISVFGQAKYQQGFSHLEYANPNAPQGGDITLGWVGNFDSLNPFAIKGISPLLMEELVFQSLGQATFDETFTQYPALAESFEVSSDKLSLTVKLKSHGRFADGTPVTADDVLFSFNLFKSDKVAAFYKSYWADIKSIEKKDQRTVVFKFARVNRELPAIATQLTILPQHFYGKGDFSQQFAQRALGSGPYLVEKIIDNATIVYKRNRAFWGEREPLFRGLYNFDTITVKYFKDSTALVEAFKQGAFDIYFCFNAKVWQNDLVGEKFTTKQWISKEEWRHRNNQGSQGFYFNLRKAQFQDVRVRKAIALAFDFAWTNEKLFFNQYTENKSFFANSPLAARGLPDQQQRAALEELSAKFPGEVPAEALSVPMGGLGEHLGIKQRLRQAIQLLGEAGYTYDNGEMINKHGQVLSFKFLLASADLERVIEPFCANLRKIGIQASIEIKEPSVYQRRLLARDFEITVLTVPQSLQPGNEQIDFWHSSSADGSYTRNHGGLKNKAVDFLVDKIIYAASYEDLVQATQLLDRVLYHLHIAVQNWHAEEYRVALWNKFGRPSVLPDYYSPFSYINLLWFDQQRATQLQKAMQISMAEHLHP